MQQFPDKALQLVEAGAPGCTPGQHSAILQRLWASVQEGRELVCWLRWVTLSPAHVSHSCATPASLLGELILIPSPTLLRLCCAGT